MEYPESIIQKDTSYCFICGKKPTEIHHCMNGIGLRKKSTKYGLVIGLCKEHHTGTNGIHNNAKMASEMKAYTQYKFEEKYSHELWISEFHKNYL